MTRPSVHRDLALQIAAVREIGKKVRPLLNEHQLAESMDIQHGDPATASSDVESKVESSRRALYEQGELDARIAWAKSLRGDAGPGVLAELRRARSLGPLRDLAVGGSSIEIQQLRTDYPNFAEVLDFVWRRALLGGMGCPPAVRLPPLLLHGPPGTGKTAFSGRLAKWLGVPVVEVDVASLETSFRLTGLDAGYATGKPGLVWQALNGESMSPVIVLDELDKPCDSTRDSGLSFLLGLLEPASATRFQDAYVGLPVDASQITWIATCNDLRNIEPPLRSRFRIFDIAAPSREQMRCVIGSVFQSLRQKEAWGHVFPEKLPDPVVEKLLDNSPRQVWQALEDACARAAVAGRRHLFAEDVVGRAEPAPRGIGFLANTDGAAPLKGGNHGS